MITGKVDVKARISSVIGLCVFIGVLLGCTAQPDADLVESLNESINQTATASAAVQEDPAEALQAAEAAATALNSDIEATRSAAQAQADQDVAATATALAPILAELPTYGADPASGSLAWQHPPLSLETEGYLQFDYANQFLATLVTDFVLSADITWNTTTGLAGCGFALRSDGNEDAPNQYAVIATRGGNGSVAFIKQTDGTFLHTDIISVEGVDPSFDWQNDRTNRLTVTGRGDTFTIYTNGVEIDSFTDAEYERGFVAMVALSESGRTECDFNNAWLWLLGDGA